MSNLTTIAISKEVAEQLKVASKNKGVSQGVYVQKMMEFFVKNNIDYTNGDLLLEAIVQTQIERVIKILRAFEKQYFKTDNLTLTELRESLLEVITAASQEIETKNESKNLEAQRKIDALNIEYANIQRSAAVICQKIITILESAKPTRKGIEIEMFKQDKEELEKEVNKLRKEIYQYNVR